MTTRPADNPFASRRIDGLDFRFGSSTIDDLIDRLDASGGRGAIVGPHGSGKTTLLERISSEIRGVEVWVKLNARTARPHAAAVAALPQALSADHAILIDGAEQLGGVAWWRLERRLRPAGKLVITSHRPARLPTIHECTTSPELLAELIDELAPGTAFEIDVEALYQRHDGNIRLCFRELYDRWAGRRHRRPP